MRSATSYLVDAGGGKRLACGDSPTVGRSREVHQLPKSIQKLFLVHVVRPHQPGLSWTAVMRLLRAPVGPGGHV